MPNKNTASNFELPNLKCTLFVIFTVVLASILSGVYIIFYTPKITSNVVMMYFGGLFVAAIVIYKILMLSSEQYLTSHGMKFSKRDNSSWMPVSNKRKGANSDEDGEEMFG